MGDDAVALDLGAEVVADLVGVDPEQQRLARRLDSGQRHGVACTHVCMMTDDPQRCQIR
jgi:hypothetical protein